ncbi:tryptophan halogenase family protein [Colwellia sp. 12G3]|uniref:tryptophan halogenase family protein n=1 Tax=Colwellia sp. 12G3 TaxID=2058299 RepID=UPI000C32CBB6|nr:tryptophan halogenase family protein [Colwellia sp. 12G3]PKI14134.1 tryptophan 7-halogenase [Colwellia sp. 12G3]
MTIKRIAIVGGGTAGWLTANHLGKTLCKKSELSITLIESPDIAPIGVGEGTVPDIKKTLASFGISETDFIRQCDVTFKQSIKFVNWLDQDKHGKDNFFHHLFDVPSREDSESLTAHWLTQNDGVPFAERVSSQYKVCEQGKAPKKITTPEYQGDLAYAYHLNAAKFSGLLADNAKAKYGVKHLLTHISDVSLADDGSIRSLVTREGEELAFDFYIDCSGFESLLISKAMKVPFVDVSDQLLVNTALVVQVPTEKDSAIPPYTIATAHQAGWIWDIALPTRRGVGFVYSNKHMSDEEAHTKLDKYLGGSNPELTYKKLPMKIGYREKFWHKNCVALGLAQGFLEPLEATSILLTDFSANFLAERFPSEKGELLTLEKRFNHAMGHAWKRVVDFIKLHYCLSDRHDSLFWSDNRDPNTMSEELKNKLAMWEKFIPISDDFFSQFEVFYLENFLFVLYGMKYKTQLKNIEVTNAEERISALKEITDNLMNNLPEHRVLLEKINKFGLQQF